MTKMEHYKKRLIQQHEKPTLMVSPVSTTEEEGDSCPPSPTSPTQNNQEKKKEEAVQSKVARKRAVCRSKYRHQNMELFKLGSSIPTSLCKTKEPYNVCTEKNLQLCYQNQNGKKCAENTPKESITESIIHTMEGTKKKDVLWRSISLNNEKAVTKQPNNTSNNVESSLTNSGRHILPAIVPEIPDRRKIKTSNIRESIPGTNEKAILGNIRVESDLIIRKAAPISINKKKSLIKRRKTVTGVEGSETENQGVDDECVPDVFDVPNQVTVKPVSERRKSVSTESELSSTSPINLSLKNQELDMRSAEGSNDPRLYTRRLYLKQILPKQYNTPQKTSASSGQNHESASVAEQSTPSSATSHESPRVYISAPNGPFTPSTQNHESGRNYIAGPSTSVQNQESVQNYVTALNKPPASSHNQEPTRNYGSGLLATEKTYEPVGPMKTPACLFQNPEPSRNYFAAPCITTNAPMPYYPNNYVGPNFPEIQQQMNRLDNPNATLPVQSHVMNARKENADTYRIIKLMKSNMDQNFTIEILLMLTKWCNELRTRSAQQSVSKKIKTSITRTINETILYISDKLFGIPCNQQLKSYAEQIIQFIEPHHKEIFKSLLPIMRVHCGDEQWMNSVIKWLSQSQQAVYASDPRTQVNNHPNPMLTVPNHNFLHPAQNNPPQNHHLIPQNHPYAPQSHPHAPQNYFYQNYRQPSLPYQGYPYQPNSSLQGNYLMNMEQHHRPGMVLSYPPNSLEAAEMQKNQQNIQALYQNGPQNFQGPVSFNVPPQTMVRPEMYLADNRCVPPKYGHNPNPEQVPQHLPAEQNRVTRSKKKDRLDIIPKPPAVTTSAIIPVSNNNVENPSHKVINNQTTDKTRKKQKETYASRQNRVIGWPNSEASTSSSNGVDYRTGPDVEELLQTSFIYNNGRTGSADTDETTSVATENNSPGLDTSVTDRSVDETTDQNIINANNNTESNQVAQEEANTNSQEDNSNENDRTVGNTVIVKDNSVEITRGNVGDNFDSKESINFIEEVSNDLTLEKVPLAQGTNGAVSTSASADNSLDDKQVINVGVKTELFDITSKMKQALLLYVGDNPDVKFQIIKEVFGSHFNGLEDYLEFLHTKKKEPREILNGNEVILIDSDEDISMEDVLDMPKPIEDPPKLIRIRTKRRDTDGNQEHQGKKLRTRGTLAASNNTDSDIILVDEDIEENIQNNSDFNQNYITIEDDANKNQELLKNPLKKEPNSEIVDTNISTDGTTAATESMVVTNVDLTASPVVNNQPLPTVEAEMPVLEAISDEETEHFRLHSRYEKRISSNTLNTLDSSEVSRCTLINGTINCIEQASRGDLFEKPLVYTKPMTPRRKISNDPARSAKGLDGPVAKRHWGSLASITHFEEDGSSTMSVVNVQPGWDLNYAFPKPRGHYPASPAYLPMESPLTSPRHLEDTGYPRLSPITSPSTRFSPNFRSPNRSVPTSPAGLSPSSAQMPSSVVSATSPIVSAGTPVALGTTAALDNSKVNWQNWFAEEKRKGFFNFDRSQSVESDSASRRQSIETTSSAGSDYLSKVPPENYCEIKIDSKTYRIKRSLYEKIPKGKLCYIRENNTFIRYFDDGQMELFLRNLNMSDGSSIASDLLKQIKGRVEGLSDVDTSLGHYASGKSEVIALSEDVSFSTADKLAVPELYVEEVEKVQRNVPRDFYGFYKYVTGYQIINHHAPISFQTFLTMHNTNGIRGLFKSYVNTLIEGHAVL